MHCCGFDGTDFVTIQWIWLYELSLQGAADAPLLQDQQLKTMSYFDPARDWPQPIGLNTAMPIVLEELAFLGDTRSRHELLVFAQANQSRLPLTMGIQQPDIPVRRMANERKTKLNDALVRILSRFLTPARSRCQVPMICTIGAASYQ